jgi:hypothetical protein
MTCTDWRSRPSSNGSSCVGGKHRTLDSPFAMKRFGRCGDGVEQRRPPGGRLAMAMAVRIWCAGWWRRLVQDSGGTQRPQGGLLELRRPLRHVRSWHTLFFLGSRPALCWRRSRRSASAGSPRARRCLATRGRNRSRCDGHRSRTTRSRSGASQRWATDCPAGSAAPAEPTGEPWPSRPSAQTRSWRRILPPGASAWAQVRPRAAPERSRSRRAAPSG